MPPLFRNFRFSLTCLFLLPALHVSPASGVATLNYTDGFDFPVGEPNAHPRGEDCQGGLRWYRYQLFERDPENGDCRDDFDCDGDYDPGHLGEDWNYGFCDNDEGLGVVSIGNGEVVYAGPATGWVGAIVMVRHLAPSGKQFFLPRESAYVDVVVSLYGHLDPATLAVSVTDPATFVARGDPLGVIGSYPSPGCPHLHLAVMVIDANEPGPGYSNTCAPDIINQYTSPSDFIHANRSPRSAVSASDQFSKGTREGSAVINPQPQGPPGDGQLSLGYVPSSVSPWTPCDNLPSGQARVGATVWDNHIFLTGTQYRVGTTWYNDGVLRGTVAADGSMVWSALGLFPENVGYNATVAWNDQLFVIGGQSAGGKVWTTNLDSNGETSDWIEQMEPLPYPLWGHQAVVRDGFIFVVGGTNRTTGVIHKNLLRSQIRADGTISPWEDLGRDLPESRTEGSLVSINNYLLYLGGWQFDETGVKDEIYSIEIDDALNPVGDWQTACTLPYPARQLATTAHNGKVFFSGGFSEGVVSDDIHSFLIDAAGIITPDPPNFEGALPYAVFGHAMLVLDERLFFIGGQPGTGVTECPPGSAVCDGVQWAHILPGGEVADRGTYTNRLAFNREAYIEYVVWTSASPAGSSDRVRYRTADAAVVWQDWSSWDGSGQIKPAVPAHYIEYQVELTSEDEASRPIVQDVTVHYRDPDPGATPVGYDVTVGIPTVCTATFDEVTAPGVTTNTTPPTPPTSPAGYRPVRYYDITTTASWSGLITLQFSFDPATIFDPLNVRLFHWDSTNSVWENITEFFDPILGFISGRTTSLSPILIAEYDAVTGIADEPVLPTQFSIRSYPNPFNPQTTIAYWLSERGPVSLRIYDVKGRLVRTLVNEYKTAGEHTVQWDGWDEGRTTASSGVYFVRVDSRGQVQTSKIVLLK